MVTFEWFNAFNARSDEFTTFKLGIWRNRWLILAILVSILLQLAVIYIPMLRVAFGTVPLSIEKWGIAVLAGVSLFLLEEIRKIFFPKLFTRGKFKP